jgi:hypothetical protein
MRIYGLNVEAAVTSMVCDQWGIVVGSDSGLVFIRSHKAGEPHQQLPALDMSRHYKVRSQYFFRFCFFFLPLQG